MEERGYLLYKNGEKEYFPEGIAMLSGYKYNDSIVEVMIPDSVLVITDNAFEFCRALRKVLCNTDSSKLIHIGEYAFNNCSELQEFQIPYSITTVNSYAFSGTKLSIMDFADTKLALLGYAVFEECYNLMKVHLNSVRHIPGKCFYYCTNLMSVSAHCGISLVDQSAFEECRSLIQIPKPDYNAVIGLGNEYFEALKK